MARTSVVLIAAATASLYAPLHGQDGQPANVPPVPDTADEAVEMDREVSGVRSFQLPESSAENPNEIVVKAPNEGDMRVPSSEDERAAAAAAMARTPCAGCVVISGAGVRVGFGKPPPVPILIDLKAIPEAPPGSAAARYAEE
jgi:hypothetical protein